MNDDQKLQHFRQNMGSIPFRKDYMNCFLCGKPILGLRNEAKEPFSLAITEGVIIMTCDEHRGDADSFCEGIKTFIAMKKTGFKCFVEESKTE